MPARQSIEDRTERRHQRWEKKKTKTWIEKTEQFVSEEERRNAIISLIEEIGMKSAARRLGLPISTIRHYQRKNNEANFHPKEHGGARNLKWTSNERTEIEDEVWNLIKLNPSSTNKEICEYINEKGYQVSLSWISSLLRKWHLSRKTPTRIQLNKYTLENIDYYGQYISGVFDLPLFKVKFMDEAHFIPKDLTRRQVLSEIGQPVKITTNVNLDERLTCTCLMQLSDEDPIVLDIKQGTNDAWDFLSFIFICLEKQYLIKDDVLILDNAPIHTSQEILELLNSIEEIFQIQIKFLPKYSPELNPVELFWGQLKNHLRCYNNGSSLISQIVSFSSCWNINRVLNCYSHCLFSWLQ